MYSCFKIKKLSLNIYINATVISSTKSDIQKKFLKILGLSNLHPTWGSNLKLLAGESHAPPTEPARPEASPPILKFLGSKSPWEEFRFLLYKIMC